MTPVPADEQRLREALFWNRIEFTDNCWLWTGPMDAKGYGHLSVNGEGMRAHRLAWMLTRGFGEMPPSDVFVCHHCDNPPCVNPGHLFLGTHLDNIQDSFLKGRRAKGERNGASKLKVADVQAIRVRCAQGETMRGLAREFGVTHGTVQRVVRREYWPEVA